VAARRAALKAFCDVAAVDEPRVFERDGAMMPASPAVATVDAALGGRAASQPGDQRLAAQ
jgi:hypothetical protein